jgi:hypothetical protein
MARLGSAEEASQFATRPKVLPPEKLASAESTTPSANLAHQGCLRAAESFGQRGRRRALLCCADRGYTNVFCGTLATDTISRH